jgi:murein DD-endopeptidase MepM/ murein hydrolase activator NlpD
MAIRSESRRSDPRHLAASALVGFVLGAFVVASLGNTTGWRNNVAPTPGIEATTPVGPLTGAVKAPASAAVDETPTAVVEVPAPTSGRTGSLSERSAEVKDLGARKLTIPVAGITPDKLVRSYHDDRSGQREHEAIDILAPMNTPVVAVEDGTIAKIFTSKAGGLTLYQFDPSQQYSYYYAHLDHYAEGVKEGGEVRRGQVIGYVGVSGNAPKNTPHLHFAVYRLTPEKHWWQGTPMDPYDILR